MSIQRRFKRALFALRPTHDHRQQRAIVVLCEALTLQGKSARDDTSADINQKAIPSLGECLDFQLDH
jgi:hypothetical protein